MKNRTFRRISLLIAMLVFATCFAAASAIGENSTGETRTIIDMTGRELEIPAEVTRYITLWPSHQSVLAMLDRGEHMVASLYDPDNAFSAWLYEMFPQLTYDESIGESMSVEEVLELDAQVVFWQNPACETLANQLIEVGIPAINISFTDYETMKQSILITAEVIGTPKAMEMAHLFNDTLDQTVQEITAKTSTIPEEDKLKVLNLRNFETLRADGKDTVADTWIGISGGVNVVSEQGLEGNQYLTVEQVFAWDPDVIVSSATGDAEWALAQADLGTLKAVQNNMVFDNPAGIFYWNRYSTETILQLKWASKLFYPDLFEDVDIYQEIRNYYKTFYSYDISDENIAQMLKVLTPVGWGAGK